LRGVRRLGQGAALVAALVLATCATSGGGDKVKATCERGLCAKLVERTALGFVVEMTAPAHASLHNAWLAGAGGSPCRGGEALNSVADDAGVRTSGPLPLEGTERLRLAFDSVFLSGEALDLDVRFPDGLVCLRLPLKPSPPSDGGTRRDGDGG
jgi:hypothetical protein